MQLFNDQKQRRVKKSCKLGRYWRKFQKKAANKNTKLVKVDIISL